MKSPLIILIELLVRLIYEQFEDFSILSSKLFELFVSLAYMGGILGWLGLTIGGITGAIVIFCVYKFFRANVKLIIILILLLAFLLIILAAVLTVTPTTVTNSTVS